MLQEESKEESRLLGPRRLFEGYDLKTELFEGFFKKVESHVWPCPSPKPWFLSSTMPFLFYCSCVCILKLYYLALLLFCLSCVFISFSGSKDIFTRWFTYLSEKSYFTKSVATENPGRVQEKRCKFSLCVFNSYLTTRSLGQTRLQGRAGAWVEARTSDVTSWKLGKCEQKCVNQPRNRNAI